MNRRKPNSTSYGAGWSVSQEPGSLRAHGFTLVEMLLVVTIIVILAALLLPTLAMGKSRGRQSACSSNLKQLLLGAQLYSGDNNGRLLANASYQEFSTRLLSSNLWILGNMKMAPDPTNAGLLRQGRLFPYSPRTEVFHCPADPSFYAGSPRVRSYAMNSWVGSRQMEQQSTQAAAGYRTFVRESEIAAGSPSTLFVFIDEHEASIDDGWFLVTMDDSVPFASLPALRHQQGYGLAFADGHAEDYRTHDPTVLAQFLTSGKVSPRSADWLRLKQVTTSK